MSRKPATAASILSSIALLAAVAPAALAPVASARTASPKPAVEPCGPVWTDVPTVPSPYEETSYNLHAIDGAAADDVWAAGREDHEYLGGGLAPVLEHWNGTRWIGPYQLPSSTSAPDPPRAVYDLNDVLAISSTDVWVVGEDHYPSGDSPDRILHWNGSSWAASPGAGLNSVLSGVAAGSWQDVWTVGHQAGQALAEHFDGSSWSLVPTPQPGLSTSSLSDVAVVGSEDAWAVGQTGDYADRVEPLAEHWNGSTWTIVATPSVGSKASLASVVALAEDDAWAVGSKFGHRHARPLVEHWDGSSWTEVSLPPDLVGGLHSVSALSADDIWASGSSGAHWDGRQWQVVDEASGSDVTAIRGGTMWTAGGGTSHLCPFQVGDSGIAPAAATARPAQPVAWSFPSSNRSTHRVKDGSGMGLFDSGPRDPGSSYLFSFPGAGTYPVIDPGTKTRTEVEVPVSTSPPTGNVGSQFVVSWAKRPPPDGFVFDVDVFRPGQVSFVPWRTGVLGTHDVFTPDAGPGAYSFEARLRAVGKHAQSGWSQPATLTATTPPPLECGPKWRIMANEGDLAGSQLNAVAALPGGEAWAVGTPHGLGAIQHWDGTSWNLSQDARAAILQGVTAISPNDAWAVGLRRPRSPASFRSFTFTEHWNGRGWREIASPSSAEGLDQLTGASGVSSADVWAVGEHMDTSTNMATTLIEHWNGAEWAIVPSPNLPDASNHLAGVAAIGPDDAWAVGWAGPFYSNPGIGTLIQHWDGTAWTIVDSPTSADGASVLNAVSATSGKDVWAVGQNGQGLVEHWDGYTWAVVPTPPVQASSGLYSVAARSPTDAWAVGWGGQEYQPAMTLTEHWDGTGWAVVPSPTPTPYDDRLNGVAVGPEGRVFAVGNAGTDYRYTPRALTLLYCET